MESVPACLLNPFIWSQVAAQDSLAHLSVTLLESFFLEPLFHTSSLRAWREF